MHREVATIRDLTPMWHQELGEIWVDPGQPVSDGCSKASEHCAPAATQEVDPKLLSCRDGTGVHDNNAGVRPLVTFARKPSPVMNFSN
jgi:hypothetical protein